MFDNIRLPKTITKLIGRLKNAGYEAYAVGGCVRDLCRGKLPSDYDITTNARPNQVKSVFNGCKTYDSGIAHGTVGVVIEGAAVEITTYRNEFGYSDLRRPDRVEFIDSLEEDLKRRDFTMNALAFDGERLVDIFGGTKDIESGIIRSIGSPDERFSEDALRILRALRFASTLGFEIEQTTADGIKNNFKKLGAVAGERIQKELIKLLEGRCAPEVVEAYKNIIEFAVSGEICKNTGALKGSKDNFYVRFALLFGDNSETVLKNLKFSGAASKKVRYILSEKNISPSKENAARLTNRIGYENAKLLCEYLEAVSGPGEELRRLIDEIQLKSAGELNIRGGDLISECGLSGKQVGEVLNRLYIAAAVGECENERCELLDYMKKNI